MVMTLSVKLLAHWHTIWFRTLTRATFLAFFVLFGGESELELELLMPYDGGLGVVAWRVAAGWRVGRRERPLSHLALRN